jgi:hypothetical protein
MEGLVRLVAESLERHGMIVPPMRIDWSAWAPLEPSLCLAAPSHPGLFVVAERIVPHALAPATVPSDLPHLAVLKIGQAKDLGVEIGRLCFLDSPLHDHIAAGRCLIRFAAVEDDVQRISALAALQHWFARAPGQDTKFSAEPVLANSAHQPKPDNPAPLPSGF